MNVPRPSDQTSGQPPLTLIDVRAAGAASDAPYHNVTLGRAGEWCMRLSAFEVAYPWHRHPNSDELFLVVEGDLELEVVGRPPFRLTPWQAITVPAGTVHRTRAIGRTVNITFERLDLETEFVDDRSA
jgi:mannose-6-phosphate isomerase-like protein (cupin superfamily)